MASSASRESPRRVGGEALDQVVAVGFPAAQIVHGGHGVLLDRLVRGLAADAGLHGFHHDGGGHQEGQVVRGLAAITAS
jgi:hypothetical protein